MHCTGIVADKQLATREERGEIGNRRLAHQTNRWAFYSGGDRVRNLLFGGCSEENDIRVCLKADRKSTRLNSSHQIISYAVFSLIKNNNLTTPHLHRRHLPHTLY